MPDSYNQTANYSIDEITAEYLTVELGKDPLLSALPITSSKENIVVWEQPENGFGLLSMRGLNSAPDVTALAGFRQYSMGPGYYGEKVLIDEDYLITHREIGTVNEPVDQDKIINSAIMQVSRRAVDRIRYIVSLLLRSGRYVIYGKSGATKHADSIEGFNSLVPTISWSSATWGTSTPIDDLLAWKILLETGTSSRFGSGSMLLMSDATIADLLGSAQFRNVFKNNYGATPMGLDGINNIMTAYGLPKIVPYNEGYYPTQALAKARSGFVKFLPAKSIIWLGTRPEGVPLGKFVMTRNLVNESFKGNKPDLQYENGKIKGASGLSDGIYTLLEFFQKPPVRYELDIGFNGGPAIEYPSAVAGISYT